MLERARAASDAELDHICLGDGHTRASPYYQGVPALARMLAEWDTSRPAGCLFLLPLWHPVIVAEQVATLATMLDAPFLLQTGVGGGAAQFDAMGADLRNRGRDLDESIRVIKGLLAGETVDSERYGLTQTGISPLPRNRSSGGSAHRHRSPSAEQRERATPGMPGRTSHLPRSSRRSTCIDRPATSSVGNPLRCGVAT